MTDNEASIYTQEQEFVDAVHDIVGAYPEVIMARDGFGHVVFRVRSKSFARLGGDLENGYSLWFKASLESQDILLQQDQYTKPPYIGQHGWVATRADTPEVWEELHSLLLEAYCQAAPKTLVKQWRQAGT